MDDKQINRALRREFRLIGWALVGYYLLMNVLAIASIVSGMVTDLLQAVVSGSVPEIDVEAIAGNAWGYLVTTAAGLTILFASKDRYFWQEQVLRKNRSMRPGVFAVMLCLCMAAQLINSIWVMGLEFMMSLLDKSLMEILEQVSGDSSTFSMFLYAAIVAPIAEELIFRGWIQRSLQPYGRRFSIVCSAFLFAVFHGNLIQAPYAFVMGLVLGYVTVEYHIGWSIGIHLFNNLILADLLTRVTAELPQAIGDGIQLILLGSATIVAGIVIFIKRQQIVNHLRSDWMDRRCVKCFFINSGIITLTVLMAFSSLIMFL